MLITAERMGFNSKSKSEYILELIVLVFVASYFISHCLYQKSDAKLC